LRDGARDGDWVPLGKSTILADLKSLATLVASSCLTYTGKLILIHTAGLLFLIAALSCDAIRFAIVSARPNPSEFCSTSFARSYSAGPKSSIAPRTNTASVRS
jgi:hypothetical protein